MIKTKKKCNMNRREKKKESIKTPSNPPSVIHRQSRKITTATAVSKVTKELMGCAMSPPAL